MGRKTYNLLSDVKAAAAGLNPGELAAFRRALLQTLPPAIWQARELVRPCGTTTTNQQKQEK